MAITDIVVSGKLFQDDGDPVEGATVQLLETGTTTVEATYTGGTTAAGLWTLTETSLDTTYDVKIASGTSVRYILWSDEIHLKGVDTSYLKVRGVEGAAAPIYFFADQADDAGDGWRMQASASDTLAIGSDKASAGTIIDYLTITNGASAAASLTTILGQLTVGVNDTGADVKFFGATAGSYWLWDESADGVVQIGTLTVGVDDAGHDVKFFGDTASAYMLWDASTDDLVLAGAAGIDLAGDIDVDGTANLDAVDIDGAVQIDATFTSGVDGQGYDTKFFGDTASAYILWDTSADKLLTAGSAVIDIVKDKLLIGGTAVTTTAAELNLLDTASANSVVNSKAVIYGSSGELAGTLSTVAQGNVTSLGTLTTLTVDNIIINGTNIGHTSDTDAIAISSGGVVTMNQVPVFSAGINVSGGTIAGTLATAAQGNVTSLGTLTALTVDNVIINGTTIGHTDDTDLMTVADGVLTVAGEVDAATLDLSSSADIAGDLVLSGGADGALQFANAGENSIKIPDNQSSALIIEEADNAYITFNTTNSSEAITVAKATTFSSTIAAATGSTIGNLTLANGSITDSSGALDFGNETLTTTGVVTAAGFTIGSAAITEAELEILDGASGRFFSFNSEVTASGGTFSSNNHRLFIPPGTTVTSAIVLSGTGMVLVIGAQCDIQTTVTLAGNNCSLYCENGVDLDGIIVSGNNGFVDGGGWDTLSNGGTANHGIDVSGDDGTVRNISAQTTAGGGSSYDAVSSNGTSRNTFDHVKVIDSDRFGFFMGNVGQECAITNCMVLGADAEWMFINQERSRVIGNFCNASGADGIEVDDGGDDTVVMGNVCVGATNDVIQINSAAEDCVVVGNRTDGSITDNSGTSTVGNNDTTAF